MTAKKQIIKISRTILITNWKLYCILSLYPTWLSLMTPIYNLSRYFSIIYRVWRWIFNNLNAYIIEAQCLVLMIFYCNLSYPGLLGNYFSVILSRLLLRGRTIYLSRIISTIEILFYFEFLWPLGEYHTFEITIEVRDILFKSSPPEETVCFRSWT